MISDNDYLYQSGSGLEVPGIEAVLEYGDAGKLKNDVIPGALRINDRSMPDQVHITELSGLQDDPEISDSRTERAGHWGERAGILMPRGRTVGLTGQIRAGNVARMRDLWRRLRNQFGRDEQDLIIHPPGEVAQHINEIWSGSGSGWMASQDVSTGSTSAVTAVTDATLNGITATVVVPAVSSAASKLTMQPTVPIPWYGRDMWMSTLIASTGTSASGLSMTADFVRYSGSTIVTVGTWTPAGAVTSPATGTYYSFAARMVAVSNLFPGATHVIPRITMSLPSTSAGGAYTMNAARAAIVMLDADQATPAGFFGGVLPGFEYTGAAGSSSSHGPSYLVNQAPDPSMSGTYWADDSTSGVTVDTAGAVVYDWPGDGRTSNLWTIHNPSTTSRTLAIRTPATLTVAGGLFVVSSGRLYRAHVRLRIDESYSAGRLQITWLAYNGAVLSTSQVGVFDFVGAGTGPVEFEIDGTVAAPVQATHAYMRLSTSTPSTTTGQRISMRVAEPRFYDVSDYDPGIIEIDPDVDPEIGVGIYTPTRTGPSVTLTPAGARRRIPRPFLLRKVRALWDGKAPESQRNLQYRRDFTMSMRASDPRTYVLDERREFIRSTARPTALSAPMSAYKTALSSPLVLESDNFAGTTAGSSLSGRVTASGATWATSGDTTDFVFADSFIGSDGVESISRSTTVVETTGRFAILGTRVIDNTQVDARVWSAATAIDNEISLTVRWVDANNYLRFHSSDATGAALRIVKVVAGVETTLSSINWNRTPGIAYRLRVIAYASGNVNAFVLSDAGALVRQIHAFDSSIASGGALQAGKQGVRDRNNSASSSGSRTITQYVMGSAIDPYLSPINFTADLSSKDASVLWRDNSVGVPYPLNGMALSPSEADPPASGYLSQDSVQRLYYSNPSVSQDQKNRVFFDGIISTGTYQLSINGQLTAAINVTDSATTVRTKIEALSNVDPGDVIVTTAATPNGPFSPPDVIIEWTGQYAFRAVSASLVNLTGADGAALFVTDQIASKQWLYATPDIIVSGNCINGNGFEYNLFTDSRIGNAWQYNYIGVVVKRISATTWLEARFNSANSAAMLAANSTSPAPPFSVELWSSHNSAGTLATTRLGGWDVPVASIVDGERKNLRAFMDETGVVYVELWESGWPNLADNGLIARNSVVLSSSLLTLFGPAVAASVGMSIKLARWDTTGHTGISVAKMRSNYDMPYISTFDVLDHATNLMLAHCPVIGDADNIPVQIELRGGLDTPIIMWSNMDTGSSASLKLSGVFLDSDPVTIDMDAGTIKSASGLDYFSSRQTGSKFFNFEPGNNVIAVQPTNLDPTASTHVIIRWRDALR